MNRQIDKVLRLYVCELNRYRANMQFDLGWGLHTQEGKTIKRFIGVCIRTMYVWGCVCEYFLVYFRPSWSHICARGWLDVWVMVRGRWSVKKIQQKWKKRDIINKIYILRHSRVPKANHKTVILNTRLLTAGWFREAFTTVFS